MKELKINKNYLLLKNWWETIDLTNYEKNLSLAKMEIVK